MFRPNRQLDYFTAETCFSASYSLRARPNVADQAKQERWVCASVRERGREKLFLDKGKHERRAC